MRNGLRKLKMRGDCLACYLTFTFGVATVVISCSTSENLSVDRDEAEYTKLEKKMQTTLPKEAILGMWYRDGDFDLGTGAAKGRIKSRTSLLFNQDGTGLVHGVFDAAENQAPPTNFSWNYLGQGVWTVEFEHRGREAVECRIADGKLLMTSTMPGREITGLRGETLHLPGMTAKTIYVRVQ